MDETIRTAAISPLRQRLIDDMNVRRFSRATQHRPMGALRDEQRATPNAEFYAVIPARIKVDLSGLAQNQTTGDSGRGRESGITSAGIRRARCENEEQAHDEITHARPHTTGCFFAGGAHTA
jgi:hypothetical protein